VNGQEWSSEQMEKLLELYPHFPAQYVADQLGRSLRSVYQMAHKIRLKGKDTRFKPGNKSWIAGRKLGPEWGRKGRMAETQFKKGLVAHNWAPVGTVRDIDGYYQVKLLPKGKHTETYRFVHHLVWELHHGAIPARHVVRFRDGNRHNTDPNNLELMDLRGHHAMNSLHALPDELRELVYLKGRITKAIRAKEKQR